MKYSEAEKQIKALSSKYSIDMKDNYFNVNYNFEDNEVAYVDPYHRYVFNIRNKGYFSKLPFGNKLYMILAELAMTPLDKRVESKKYYIKIYDSGMGYLNIDKFTGNMSINNVSEDNIYKTKFTDKDIGNLMQREDIPLDWSKVSFMEAK